MMNLRLTTWNISGVMYNLRFLQKLLEDCDIFCLQEHWLYEDALSFLDTVHVNFKSWGKSDPELNLDSISRRGSGGLAFLWRKNLDPYCEVLDELSCDRIAVLNLRPPNSEQIYIVGVYLPTTSAPASRYNMLVDRLENIVYQLCNSGKVIVMGDFNAHIGSYGGSRSFSHTNSRGLVIGKLMQELGLMSLNSQDFCTGPRETFFSNGGLTKTTVDHIFYPENSIDLVSFCTVLEECSSNLSFHLPISCAVQIDIQIKLRKSNQTKLAWKYVENEAYLSKYQEEVATNLANTFPEEQCINSVEKVEEAVEIVIKQLKEAAYTSIPIEKIKPYLKNYWNPSLTALNKKVKFFRRIWIEKGQPRGQDHRSFVNYKIAKQEFRRTQRRAIYEQDTSSQRRFEYQFEIDRSKFYKKVSNIKKKTRAGKDALRINGKLVDDDDELLSIWKNHYQDLCTPRDNPAYDNDFKQFVEDQLRVYSEESYNHDDPLDVPFDVKEVKTVCQKLPNGKAGGPDDLTYEHLKYGGDKVYECLTHLYNAASHLECVAENWSVGNIISLFKNGKKDRRNKDNFRGITLLNVIGKVLERLVLNRWMPIFQELGVPNELQFAYQEDKSCVLSSFVLQEMIHYNVEKESKVYSCFMDSSKAFDTVWLDGLFFKLYNLGLRGKTWRILRNWYKQMSCSVSLNGKTSTPFPVKQGVRQGGVLSPWLFLCFNNDIPDILMQTHDGITMGDIHCPSVNVADDITLLSTQVNGLQRMINTMEAYSNKWRFDFNPGKTVVVTFGETTQMHTLRKPTRQWHIKGVKINEKRSWDHVGINLSGNFSSHERSTKATKKGKQVMGELMSAGFKPGGINPICGASVWKAFGIPAMLYGSELWNNLNDSEKEMLNRASVFSAKRLQGLPITTRAEGALGAIGLWTTAGYIDKMKLLFFGNLCRSSPDYLHKKIFIRRLFSYLYHETDKPIGFVPDIVALLRKYNLYTYLDQYLLNSHFPTKSRWRTLVINSIRINQEDTWKERRSQKPELIHFNRTHPKLEPLFHWVVAKRNPFHRLQITNLVNLLCGNIPTQLMSTIKKNEDDYICRICGRPITDVGFHFIMDCSGTNMERNLMWDALTDLLTVSQVSQLHNMDDVDTYEVLISSYFPFLLNDDNLREQLILLVADAVFTIYKKIHKSTSQLAIN